MIPFIKALVTFFVVLICINVSTVYAQKPLTAREGKVNTETESKKGANQITVKHNDKFELVFMIKAPVGYEFEPFNNLPAERQYAAVFSLGKKFDSYKTVVQTREVDCGEKKISISDKMTITITDKNATKVRFWVQGNLKRAPSCRKGGGGGGTKGGGKKETDKHWAVEIFPCKIEIVNSTLPKNGKLLVTANHIIQAKEENADKTKINWDYTAANAQVKPFEKNPLSIKLIASKIPTAANAIGENAPRVRVKCSSKLTKNDGDGSNRLDVDTEVVQITAPAAARITSNLRIIPFNAPLVSKKPLEVNLGAETAATIVILPENKITYENLDQFGDELAKSDVGENEKPTLQIVEELPWSSDLPQAGGADGIVQWAKDNIRATSDWKDSSLKGFTDTIRITKFPVRYFNNITIADRGKAVLELNTHNWKLGVKDSNNARSNEVTIAKNVFRVEISNLIIKGTKAFVQLSVTYTVELTE